VLSTTNDPVLRSELDRITDRFVGDAVGQQITAVKVLQGHNIRLESEAVPDNPKTFRFTCFQFALGLTDPPELIVQIATIYSDVFPNSEFVNYLVVNYLTEIALEEIQEGDIVIYYTGGTPTHAGLIKNGLVVSKWGTAHLWQHNLFEVPQRYGNEVRFFRPITEEDSQLAFLRYAEMKTGRRFSIEVTAP
jgi:hypothetical protein